MFARKIRPGRAAVVTHGSHAGQHVTVGRPSAVEPGMWSVSPASGLGSFRVWPEDLMITGTVQ